MRNRSPRKKFNSYQFLKNDQCPLCRVAVRFSGTLLEQFFPLVQPVNYEFSFTWIAVLQRQVDTKTVYF